MRWATATERGPADEADEASFVALLFRLGGQLHAVSLDGVEGVVRAKLVRRVPQPPSGLAGVLERGDETIPVADLCRRLEVEPRVGAHVVLHRSSGGLVGYLVEQAVGVRRVQRREVPDAVLRGGSAVNGMVDAGDETAFLLDLERVPNY